MTVTIPLTQGFATVIDDDDAALAVRKWFANRHKDGRVYAVRNKARPEAGLLGMHRVITGAPDGKEVDHINGDTLDNRRSNLRVVTRAENAQNLATRKNTASGHRGVRWHAGTWESRVQREGKIVYWERFSTLEDAVTAVRLARKRLLPFDAQGTIGVVDGPMPAPAPHRLGAPQRNALKTHCGQGHPLSGANLMIERYNGGRRCLTCRRTTDQRKAARKRERKATGLPWGEY